MRYSLIITLISLWPISNLSAQCAFDNFYYTDATPPCPGTSSVFCAWGGDYLSISVIQGNVYEFSTCGNIAFDTQLTLYGEALQLLGYNDDFCGLQSLISWTATYTGEVFLMVDEFPCVENAICMDVTVTCQPDGAVGSGCNTDVILCQNTAGPFSFGAAGPPVSSCLDWFNTSQFAYIMVNITTTGPLNLLIQGDAASGFLDVAVFNIPNGVPPCDAIQNLNNQIGCNYASAFSGCNQFGTSYPCLSSVPAPFVTAGQTIMIVVEDWQNGASSNFTLQLGPPPNAQSGPANAAIIPVGPFCINANPVQLVAQDAGGTWSGPGTSASGEFDPGAAGIGTHFIEYEIGLPPCLAEGNTQIQVVNAPVASGNVSDPSICVGESSSVIINGTPNAVVTYTLNNGTPLQITLNNLGTANIPLNGLTGNVSVQLTAVTLPGTPPCTQLLSNPPLTVSVAPSPSVSPIFHD